jgi:hypothetical protein
MYVKPKISHHQAEIIFSIKKSSISLTPRPFLRRNPSIPGRLELLYIPFYLFDVLVEKEVKSNKRSFSPRQYVSLTVDGFMGHAVLYAKDGLDVENGPKRPAPTCDFEISANQASKIALEQYKGVLLEHGMRTHSQTYATKISEGRKIFYPFWVGYFQKKRGYDFKALDAVSGEIQGVRMRRVFMKAFRKLA